MYEKRKPLRLAKITKAARGEPCTVESPWCVGGEDTTVACHYGDPGEKGTATKPDDSSVVFACCGCHDYLDGRVQPVAGNNEQLLAVMQKEWYWFRAMRRTWRRLIEIGTLK